MDVDVNSGDLLLTLFTCTRFYGFTNDYSFRVDARKLRKGERTTLAEVKTNDNYKVIKDRMEEGEEDEPV